MNELVSDGAYGDIALLNHLFPRQVLPAEPPKCAIELEMIVIEISILFDMHTSLITMSGISIFLIQSLMEINDTETLQSID